MEKYHNWARSWEQISEMGPKLAGFYLSGHCMSHKDDGWLCDFKNWLVSQLIWCRKQTCQCEASLRCFFFFFGLLLVLPVDNHSFVWRLVRSSVSVSILWDMRKGHWQGTSLEWRCCSGWKTRSFVFRPLWNFPAADWTPCVAAGPHGAPGSLICPSQINIQ